MNKYILSATLLLCQFVSLATLGQTNHTVWMVSVPEGASTFYINGGKRTSLEATPDQKLTVQANANTGYVLDSLVTTDIQLTATNNSGVYTFNMPEADVTITAYLHYAPTLPPGPNENDWHPETGEAFITSTTPGSLSNAIRETVSNDQAQLLKRITVAGICQERASESASGTSDWDAVSSRYSKYTNLTFIDMSRTSGLTYVPSNSFSDDAALSNIMLPSTTTVIGKQAFQNCNSLRYVTCYAITPPQLGKQAFEGTSPIVYVPGESLPLYMEAEGWKDLTLLPITEHVSSMQVNLPAGVSLANFQDMFLELVNTKTGQQQRYVITSQQSYTFNNLIHGTQYNIYIRNARDEIVGEIMGVDMVDKDVSVTFTNLKRLLDVGVRLLSPAGKDVSDQATITWTDKFGNYLQTGRLLKKQVEGSRVGYSIKMSESLGTLYQCPATTLLTVGQQETVDIALTAIPQITIGGTVVSDETGRPIRGATVTIVQNLNGIFTETLTAVTNSEGQWTQTVRQVPSNITIAAEGYVNQTMTTETVVDDTYAVKLAEITGTTVSLDLYYRPAVPEGEELVSADNYNGFADITYHIYDETRQLELNDFTVQLPLIVLPERLAAGTQLRITASSINEKFMPELATCTVDTMGAARASLVFTQYGAVVATVTETENLGLTGMLYKENGQLAGRGTFAANAGGSKPTLAFSELPDGQYTLITMGESRLFNAFTTLDALASSGLKEDADYVAQTLRVVSGHIDSVKIGRVPVFDESLYYYTGDDTRFSANKTQVTMGNYVTLRSQVSFKPEVAGSVRNVQLVFELPDGCPMVDNSMMVGTRLSNYQTDGQQVSVSLDNIADAVRFCVLPTERGTCMPSAAVVFTLNGKTIRQPIGSASFDVQALSLMVPEKTSLKTVPVNGTGMSGASVEIFDGGILIGQTLVQPSGTWSVRCPLNAPYNLTTHSIYAVITSPDGIKMTTESKQLTCNQGSLAPVVTMSFYNHYNNGDVKVKWDFSTGKCDLSNYGWPMDQKSLPFTFRIDFMDGDVAVNDTLAFGNIVLTVFLDDGTELQTPATFNKSMNAWVVQHDLTTNSLPVNVDVSYATLTEPKMDRGLLDELNSEVESYITESMEAIKDIYHEFDELMEEPSPSETVTALNELLSQRERDAAANQRVDSLLTVIAGEEVAMESDVSRTFNMIDDLQSSGKTDYETLKQIDALLDPLADKLLSAPIADVDTEAIMREVEAINSASKEFIRQVRDSLIANIAPMGTVDTTAVVSLDNDYQFTIPAADRDKTITIKHLETIDKEQLLAEGYIECPMTDGSSLFYLYDDDGFKIIDTKDMTLQSVNIAWKDDITAGARGPRRASEELEWLKNLPKHECFVSVFKSFKDLGVYAAQLKQIRDGVGGNLDMILYTAGFCASAMNDIPKAASCLYEQAYKFVGERIVNKNNKLRNEANAKYDEAVDKEKNLRNRYKEKHKEWREQNKLKEQLETDIASYEKEIAKTKALPSYDERYMKALEDGLAEKVAKKNACSTKMWDLEDKIKDLSNAIDKLEGVQVKQISTVVSVGQKEAKAFKNMEWLPKSINACLSSKTVMTVAEWAKWLGKMKIGGTTLGVVVDFMLPLIPTVCDAIGCCEDLYAWINLSIPILRKLPCDEDQENLLNIISDYTKDFLIHGIIDCSQVLCDLGSMVFDKLPEMPYHLQVVPGLLCDIGSGAIAMFHPQASANARDVLLDRLNGLKCKKDDDKKDSSKKFSDIKPIRDPSGYVYEAVESNRLEGVKATCFYKEEVEDMYGDLHENVVVWDAEEYAQQNPLFTDSEGKYAWDVPTGLWQVKFEKDGYETAYSEWLPVPPPQLEVNVGMTQLRQPSVQRVKAFTDGIDITFDKYMRPATLTAGNILLTKDGQVLDGRIELLNADSGYETPDSVYASKVRINLNDNLNLNDKVQLTVRKAVESYAGLRMEQDFTQLFPVEQRIVAIVADSLLYMAEGSEQTVTVSIVPAEAAKGKTLLATSLADDVVTVTRLQGEPEGVFSLRAQSLGSSAIRFSLADDELTATTLVHVRDTASMYVYSPVASRMSGTEVYRGAEIRLTCPTAGATIVYTLDGSCPCDAQSPGVMTYRGPITAEGTELTIRAMAVANGMAESDVAEFRYKVVDNPVSVEPILPSPTTPRHLSPVTYYRLDGCRVTKPQRGLNIVRSADGTVRKVVGSSTTP